MLLFSSPGCGGVAVIRRDLRPRGFMCVFSSFLPISLRHPSSFRHNAKTRCSIAGVEEETRREGGDFPSTLSKSEPRVRRRGQATPRKWPMSPRSKCKTNDKIQRVQCCSRPNWFHDCKSDLRVAWIIYTEAKKMDVLVKQTNWLFSIVINIDSVII